MFRSRVNHSEISHNHEAKKRPFSPSSSGSTLSSFSSFSHLSFHQSFLFFFTLLLASLLAPPPPTLTFAAPFPYPFLLAPPSLPFLFPSLCPLPFFLLTLFPPCLQPSLPPFPFFATARRAMCAPSFLLHHTTHLRHVPPETCTRALLPGRFYSFRISAGAPRLPSTSTHLHVATEISFLLLNCLLLANRTHL